MNILSILGLDAGYGAKKILTNINLTVQAGQFISIIAPNGTGKSTFLKTVAGILPPLQGEIRLAGKSLATYKRRDLAKKIAMVSSDITENDFTAWQMVMMGRFPHIPRFSSPCTADKTAVQAAMEDAGIWPERNSHYSKLSQGEQQKVIIARALAQQPELLLLDEPTAHLDICNQFGVLQLIKDLATRKQMAIIAAIHDINLALQFSSHLVFLKNGAIVGSGPTDEVLCAEILSELYGMTFILNRDSETVYVRPNLFE